VRPARVGGIAGRPISSLEIEEPLSWVAGIAALAFAWGGFSALNPLFYLSPSFIAILIGFAVHEMAHKLVAIRYGGAAGFVAYGPGLLITFLSGLIPGIAILAPGYVRVVGWSDKTFFYSVTAGPASNIVIALVGVALAGVVPGALKPYIYELVSINAFLAFFNLLPIPPLDGSKIIRHNAAVWGVLIVSSIVLMLA
jgi:Zn-dependent protease